MFEIALMFICRVGSAERTVQMRSTRPVSRRSLEETGSVPDCRRPRGKGIELLQSSGEHDARITGKSTNVTCDLHDAKT